MKKLNEILVVFIFMLTAVLTAAVGLKAYDIYDTRRQLAREQEELELARMMVRNEEAHARVAQMRTEILELAEDKEELERFISRIQSSEQTVSGNGSVSSNGTVSGNGSVSSNSTVSGNGSVSSNSTVSGNGSVSSNSTVSGNDSVSSNGNVTGNGIVSSNEFITGNGTV